MSNWERVYKMPVAAVYPHYLTKAEKKGRTKEEVHAIIHWLTGYDEQALQQQIERERTTSLLDSQGRKRRKRSAPKRCALFILFAGDGEAQ